jgi:Acetyltransferase (GNAT) domain
MNFTQDDREPRSLVPRGGKLSAMAFGGWTPALDEALRHIPEDADFQHALVKMLAKQQTGRRKRIWLISENGAPAAVAALVRSDGLTWQPITQYILPGMVIPAVKGRLFDSLNAIGLNLRLGLWRTNCPLPQTHRIRDLVTTATYGIDCTEDFEAYWKSTDMWRRLRSARNRWKHLTLKENAPGASEWVISNWARKWSVPEEELADRLLVARFLEPRGKHFSLTLFDGDRPVAGQTCLSHRGEMIGQCLYREEGDGNVGNRLIHLSFEWARDKGFRAIDIGGGHDYKRKFAPQRGERHEFTMAPFLTYVSSQALSKTRWRLRSLMNGARDGSTG